MKDKELDESLTKTLKQAIKATNEFTEELRDSTTSHKKNGKLLSDIHDEHKGTIDRTD